MSNKNYDDMSDFEINKLVAGHLHGEEWWHKYSTVLIMRLMPTDSGGMGLRKAPVDYCHNPLDSWPIIIDNKFSITSWGNKNDFWMVSDCPSWDADNPTAINVADKNPLRAAMICFLKIMDERGHA